jgi:hypothetical protein
MSNSCESGLVHLERRTTVRSKSMTASEEHSGLRAELDRVNLSLAVNLPAKGAYPRFKSIRFLDKYAIH